MAPVEKTHRDAVDFVPLDWTGKHPPAMPASAAQLLDLLAVPEEGRSFAGLGEAGRLKPGTELPPPQGVFPRYVEKEEGA